MLPVLDRAGDPDLLSHEECLELLESIEAERAALDAVQQRTLAALHRRDPSEKGWTADEVACVLRLSPRTAPGILHDARQLVDRLPRTLALLADATISLRHARALVDAVQPLDDATTEAVETRALRRAPGSTVSEFRQTVRRAVTSLDRRRVEEQHEAAVIQRRVVCTEQDDGMSEIWSLLPTDAAARVMARLNRHAAAARGRDDRTADQRRADALVDLVDPRTSLVGSDGGVDGHGARIVPGAVGGTSCGPSVHVTVALMTLLELDDRPGELAGHGPIPASVARRMAADPTGSWRRIVTDRIDGLISVSRAYRPPLAMREHVAARDRTCRFPGCGRAAPACELDHLVPWDGDRGGPTTYANLHALCARHHHLKHEARGWQVHRSPDGVTTWRTPGGRVIDVPPEPYDDWEDRALRQDSARCTDDPGAGEPNVNPAAA